MTNNMFVEARKTLLTENRREDLEYSEKKAKGIVNRVIVTLKGKDSEKNTKLTQKYVDLLVSIEKMQEEASKLNQQVKDEVFPDLFNAEDEVLTRVVETCSVTLTLAKATPPTPAVPEHEVSKVNYQKISEELTKLIPQELTSIVETITKSYTEIITVPATDEEPAKSPALRATLKKEGISDISRKMFQIGKKLFREVSGWARNYDKKLNDIKRKVAALST